MYVSKGVKAPAYIYNCSLFGHYEQVQRAPNSAGLCKINRLNRLNPPKIKVWYIPTLPFGALFMAHSLTPTHPRRPHRLHLSVIGQLSLCARALLLAVEWHFVPQQVSAVCHAGLCISVRCHAVPKPWQGTNIIHTPVRLTEP